MSLGDLKSRQRVVTDEPFAIAADIRGRELAGVRRRGFAILIDLAIVAALGTPFLLVATLVALYVQSPVLARSLTGESAGTGVDDRGRGTAQLLALVERRRPHALPLRFSEPLARGDLDAVERLLEDQPIDIFSDLGTRDPTWFDTDENRLHIHGDVIFGPWASAFSFAALALVYFTLALRLGRGRTPGKWLTGLRVVRLDGRPIRLWDAFGRAGGYAASLSTLGLGFFESLWDPNRQALHDRVASTVVVRIRRAAVRPPAPRAARAG